MSVDRIRLARKRTIGTNQTTKALQQNQVKSVYVARDAEPRVIESILGLARQRGLSVIWVETMKQLGKACGIEVGAATAAVIEE